MTEIEEILGSHQRWLEQEEGFQAFLYNVDLTGFNFSNQNFSQIKIRKCNLTNCDFSNSNLTGAKISRCFGTNVNFNGADLTNSDFEKSDISGFNFIGAIWGGETLPANPIQWMAENQDYWCMQTDNYIQVGCVLISIADLAGMSNEERSALDSINSAYPNEFWTQNEVQIQAVAAQYSTYR